MYKKQMVSLIVQNGKQQEYECFMAQNLKITQLEEDIKCANTKHKDMSDELIECKKQIFYLQRRVREQDTTIKQQNMTIGELQRTIAKLEEERALDQLILQAFWTK